MAAWYAALLKFLSLLLAALDFVGIRVASKTSLCVANGGIPFGELIRRNFERLGHVVRISDVAVSWISLEISKNFSFYAICGNWSARTSFAQEYNAALFIQWVMNRARKNMDAVCVDLKVLFCCNVALKSAIKVEKKILDEVFTMKHPWKTLSYLL